MRGLDQELDDEKELDEEPYEKNSMIRGDLIKNSGHLNKASERQIVPGAPSATNFSLTGAELPPDRGVRRAMRTEGQLLQDQK